MKRRTVLNKAML